MQNCGRLRLQSGGCFPIILLLPSSKKPFMSPLLPFVWAACHKALLPNNPPHLLSRNHRLPLTFWCEIPHFWEQANKKTPKSPSLAPNFSPHHELHDSTDSTPISALAGAPRGKIASARERHMFPITRLSLRRVLVTRDLTK